MTRNSFVIVFWLFLLHAFCANAQSDTLNAVVSADKMNVLYIGLDNPLSIAVPGIPSDKVSAELSKNGTLTQVSPGRYVANVTQVDLRGETEVRVYAEMPDGSKKLMDSVHFRVKRVPDPVAMVGPYSGGEVKAPIFKIQKGMQAVLPNFDFDIRFAIIGCEMIYVPAAPDEKTVTLSTEGALFSGAMLEVLAKACPGDKFIFDKIKAKGPDGIIRNLKSLVFNLI